MPRGRSAYNEFFGREMRRRGARSTAQARQLAPEIAHAWRELGGAAATRDNPGGLGRLLLWGALGFGGWKLLQHWQQSQAAAAAPRALPLTPQQQSRSVGL